MIKIIIATATTSTTTTTTSTSGTSRGGRFGWDLRPGCSKDLGQWWSKLLYAARLRRGHQGSPENHWRMGEERMSWRPIAGLLHVPSPDRWELFSGEPGHGEHRPGNVDEGFEFCWYVLMLWPWVGGDRGAPGGMLWYLHNEIIWHHWIRATRQGPSFPPGNSGMGIMRINWLVLVICSIDD